jgi:PAS domain S-box-containing protein
MEKLSILLVDDDEDDALIIRDLVGEVQGLKLELKWVPTYEQAVEELDKQTYGVCLVDYRLGARTGLELIRERVSAGSSTPFVMLTGAGDRNVDLKAMQAGAEDYLVKSQLNSNLLERSIRYAVHHARALQAIKEREENFRSLLDSTFEGILVCAADGQVVTLNRAAASLFGYDLHEMLNLSTSSVLDMSQVPQTHSGANSSLTFETTGFRKDGTRMQVEISRKPYRFKNRDLFLCAVRDVTAKKQMEAQILMQDRLASVGLLASSLAHEIGTPLGVIRGRAEFLCLQVKDIPEVKKNVDVILTQIDRVSHLIRSLLNLARGEKGREPVSVSLSQVVNEVVELMGHELRRNDIAVTVHVPEDIRLHVKAESQPMQQVLLNLLVNAVHAIDEAKKKGRTGQHSIRIEARSLRGECVLSVHDSGCGISPQNMKHLFTPFFTTKEVGVGTGLGLATSYRIVEAWGGTIRVESELGQGTIFRITLPQA